MDSIRDAETGFMILIFAVEDRKYALPLSAVEKVEFASDITPFPEGPNVFIGAIDWKGQIIPVLSMRRRLHTAEREVRTSDRFIIIHTPKRTMALLVDSVNGIERAERKDFIASDALSDRLGSVAGAARRGDEIVLICDPDLFLSEAEEKNLVGI